MCEGLEYVRALFSGGLDGTVTARDGGLECRRGLYSHKFVRKSPGLGVDCHIHPHLHERERLAKWFWLKLGANVFFKRTGAALPVTLLKDHVVGACLLIIYMGQAVSSDDIEI